ncbi:hypothetical protein CDD81_1038 [Ophiocordyceps australis]|uniref:Uncharacterized protein n=1 Tax=Ophiocordyceps australis TaxID=1399860 RepID=A0A2C5XWV0_9HYPO|nr:hypothetical protein CDD81_1038 [Ophiocordyceps australis]
MKALALVIVLAGLAAAAEQSDWANPLRHRSALKPDTDAKGRVGQGATKAINRDAKNRQEKQRAEAAETARREAEEAQRRAVAQLQREKSVIMDLQRMREVIRRTNREEQLIMQEEAEATAFKEQLLQAVGMNINTERLKRQLNIQAQRRHFLQQAGRAEGDRTYQQRRQNTALKYGYQVGQGEAFLFEDFLLASSPSRCMLI